MFYMQNDDKKNQDQDLLSTSNHKKWSLNMENMEQNKWPLNS